jgi:hypothetical protein
MFTGISTAGSDIYGGLTQGIQTEIPINPPPGPPKSVIKLTIGGVDLTGSLFRGRFVITDELNNRNTCTFRLTDVSQATHVLVGSVVRLTNNGALIFAGTVDSYKEMAPTGSFVNFIDVNCVDFNQLASRHVVAQKYLPGYSFRDIVTDIVNVHSGDVTERLADEGVTYSIAPADETIPAGPTMATLVFNYKTVAESFDDLSKLVGYAWNIDYTKKLWWYDRANQLAPVAIDADTWAFFRVTNVQKTREKYRNVQMVRAGNDTSLPFTESWKGDGETRTFTTRLPMAEAPTSVTVNSVAKTFGVDQVDTGKDWYYRIDDSVITQDSGGTKLGTGDTLTIVYRGFYPISELSRDDAEVALRKSIEGGTGTYWEVEEDESIDDRKLAEDYTASLLRRYGRIPTFVEFETEYAAFRSGQLLTVRLPEHGIDAQFLIESVRIESITNDVVQYSVKAIDGETQGGWSEFYKELSTKGRPFQLRENEKLSLLRTQKDTIVISETATSTAPLDSWALDPLTVYLCGTSRIGGSKWEPGALTPSGIVYGPRIGKPVIP